MSCRTRFIHRTIWTALVLVGTTVSAFPGNNGSLNWQAMGGYRGAAVPVPVSGKTGLSLVPPEVTGIRFTNALPEGRAMTNANLMNGSGVALGDYDGDGLCDIYLCNLNGTNALYKNLGAWKFKDVTEEAGAACPGQTSTGAVFADVNGDGYLDLLVTSMGGPNACFLNDGHGHFTNVTAAAGLVSKLGSTSMALADIDGNGTLDLYVANYGVFSVLRTGGAFAFSYVNGQPVVRGRYAQRIKVVDGMMYELGEPSVLYLNDGKGKFTPVSWSDGRFLDENGKPLAQTPWDQSLSVVFRDLNGDGFPDLYVCNDAYTPDRCWINDGHGRFRELNHLAWRSTSYFSMGIDFADIDRDGYDDFFVVDMLSRQHRLVLTQRSTMHPQPRVPGGLDTQLQIRRNTLFLNRGDGTYAEIANYGGVAASEWSWSGIFLDVDLDGWEDILISNGFHHDVDDADTKQRVLRMTTEESRKSLPLFPRLSTPNVAFHNQRDLTFREVGKEWGFDSIAVSNGMALADLDNDGDLDVVVNCLNGPALIYRNETAAPRLAVRLRGNAPNVQGIGAKIKIYGGPVTQSQEVVCGGRYMSSDDPMRVFAASHSTNLTIEVTWRTGTRSVVRNCQPNHVYEIDEATGGNLQSPKSKLRSSDVGALESASVGGVGASERQSVGASQRGTGGASERAGVPGTNSEAHAPRSTLHAPPLFEDVSELLHHNHHEEVFDDFTRQPLLPNRLSQLGPGVAWFDLDGDGRDDLIVASGKGGKLAMFHNDPRNGFQAIESPALKPAAGRDQTTVLGWSPAPGTTALLVGSANYEDGLTNGESVLRYDFVSGELNGVSGLPAQIASAGPLAMADMHGGGNLDLFVGGRVIPGRYPEAAPSYIYHYDGKQWQLETEDSRILQKIGLVSSAVWSDLDGDGFPELILACEWGPVRVFKNVSGKLRDGTEELGLASLTGWWTGVTTGDVDGDGRLDIVAGNWGLNSACHTSHEHPARLYFGDWKQSGNIDLLEAEDDAELGIVPRRDLGAVSASLPFVQAKFSTYKAFAQTDVAGILGDKMQRTQQLKVNTLESMVFFNRGGHFEAVRLPREAQFAPAFAVCVADLDGDGNEDVFLSQNFFATPPDMPRLDGGRGLWLRNDGTGKLNPVPGHDSGIKVYGEQRGAALADFNGDGRVDLVVTQNGAPTKLFQNIGAKPGLRVRLMGPRGNPLGIGATVRLQFGQSFGPAREIHAGSGYWSQDSAVQVLAAPESATQIWIRWPGGGTTTTQLPPVVKEVAIDTSGKIVSTR